MPAIQEVQAEPVQVQAVAEVVGPHKVKAPKKDRKVKVVVKVVKKAQKAVKPENGSSSPKSNPLQSGSTRSRLFRALKRFSNGLTALEIKERTGMLPGSGHLAVLLGEELEAKRIRLETHPSQEDADSKREITSYFLTAKGKKDLENGNVDKRSSEGRVGVKWTKLRRAAE